MWEKRSKLLWLFNCLILFNKNWIFFWEIHIFFSYVIDEEEYVMLWLYINHTYIWINARRSLYIFNELCKWNRVSFLCVFGIHQYTYVYIYVYAYFALCIWNFGFCFSTFFLLSVNKYFFPKNIYFQILNVALWKFFVQRVGYFSLQKNKWVLYFMFWLLKCLLNQCWNIF